MFRRQVEATVEAEGLTGIEKNCGEQTEARVKAGSVANIERNRSKLLKTARESGRWKKKRRLAE